MILVQRRKIGGEAWELGDFCRRASPFLQGFLPLKFGLARYQGSELAKDWATPSGCCYLTNVLCGVPMFTRRFQESLQEHCAGQICARHLCQATERGYSYGNPQGCPQSHGLMTWMIWGTAILGPAVEVLDRFSYFFLLRYFKTES